MRAGLPLLALLGVVLAGCVDPGVKVDVTAPLAASLRAGDEEVSAQAGLRWAGARLAGNGPHPYEDEQAFLTCFVAGIPCETPRAPCGPANCEVRTVELSLPEPSAALVLEASIRWPTISGTWLALTIRDEEGRALAEGQHVYASPMALVALLENPKAGRYTIEVAAVSGAADYEAVVQLESRSADGRTLLPNLVTLPPTDLRIERSPVEGGSQLGIIPGEPIGTVAATVTGSKGCNGEESFLYGARKCLRFSNAVGNIGDGPLEIRLSSVDAATSAAGGSFKQRLYRDDGTWTERVAGEAEFHVNHAHWHDAAANAYRVHAYDVVNQTVGDELTRGRKAGICFADIGLVDLGLPTTWTPRFSGAACFAPHKEKEWFMGLSPSFYDSYPWLLGDQYVEVNGLEDGVYALCSSINPAGALVESNPDDNEACTAFRLEGDAVETLSSHPYHKMVE